MNGNNKTIYQFECEDALGKSINFLDFKGQILLIVNTASKCGFTPQYDGLEKLHNQYKGLGFSVLAFPCNQFGAQEPGSNLEIQEFCSINFKTTFPVFNKIAVKGEDAHPLYRFLTAQKKGFLGSESIKWNFTKFLINREGEPVTRYAPNTTPEKIEEDLKKII